MGIFLIFVPTVRHLPVEFVTSMTPVYIYESEITPDEGYFTSYDPGLRSQGRILIKHFSKNKSSAPNLVGITSSVKQASHQDTKKWT